MHILLDECLPRKFGLWLAGHNVRSVQTEGWSGIKNGELLKRASGANFNVFITMDRNLPYQQSLRGLSIAVIVLAARSNDLADLTPLAEFTMEALSRIQPGEITIIGA